MPTLTKGRCARILAKFPGSSKLFGPPRSYAKSINDLDFAECRKISRLKDFRCVNHLIPRLEGYPQLESHIVQKFQKINEREQELYLLPEARILGSGFFHPVITNRDRFVLEQAAYELEQGSHPAHYALKLPRIKKISGPTFSLVERWSDNYCHWLFECVGKWLLIQQNNKPNSFPSIQKFAALNVSKYPFKRQVLEAIGITESQIVDIGSSEHILFSELYIADAPYSINLPGADLVDALRMKILPKVSKKSTSPRIFISREKSANRRAENEEEIEGLLAKYGFEKVILEELTFLDQVELFYNAKVIFSQHGAGLVNIVFAQKGTMVLELFETDFINPCYAILAEKLRLKYRMLANPFYKQFRVGGAWLDKPKSVKIDCKNLEKELSNIQY